MENLSTEIQPETLLETLIDRRYRLTRFLGSGSHGLVFEAAEESLGSYISRVAVKIIILKNEDERLAVQREVRGLAQLNHDHIIIYRTSGEVDQGRLAGAVFVVTELADTSLECQIRTATRIDEGEVRQMALGIARALAHCHRLGAIHRDVKPANIFQVQDRWKLADFGLVHSQSEERQQSTNELGSYAYMAPEVLDGNISPKIDVYSLGVTILECLTNELAHAGSTVEEFRSNLGSQPARIPDNLDASWRDLVTACLERDPVKRLSAAQVAERLGDNSTEEHSISGPTSLPLALGTLIVSSLGRGQCLTISEAIKVAPDGARIFVRPGRYRENLILDKPVEIVADGAVQEVILETSGVVLRATGASATIRGLTVRSHSHNGDPKRFAVEVEKGILTLDRCEITCDSLAGIAVCQQGAEATMYGCRIHQCGDVGLWVTGGGSASIENCLVVGNASSGICVGDASTVVVRSSKLQRGLASGLHVHKGGQATCTDCDFASNAKAGVVVGERGKIELHGCRFSNNSAYGVWMEAGAGGTIAKCKFENNHGGPWSIPNGCQVQLSDNVSNRDGLSEAVKQHS